MKINQGYDYDGAPKRPARDPGRAGAEPLRFDYAFPLTKEPYDRVQQFRFGGGRNSEATRWAAISPLITAATL
jgi:hypothetical protein